jgi:glycerophosphoryl diester phosphodiesterase
VVKALKPARAQCVVISFDLAAVHRVRQIGGMPIGWVVSAYDEHTRLKFEALQPEFLFVDHEMLPPAGALWRGPWRWAVYEVESIQMAQALAARGADYIETMKVHEMSEAMRQLQQPARSTRPGA